MERFGFRRKLQTAVGPRIRRFRLAAAGGSRARSAKRRGEGASRSSSRYDALPGIDQPRLAVHVIGGWLIAAATGIMIPADYVDGLLMDFRPYSITYTLIKTVFFAYIITSISAFYGYYARGNSLEVGAASTRAVVASSIVILLFSGTTT